MQYNSQQNWLFESQVSRVLKTTIQIKCAFKVKPVSELYAAYEIYLYRELSNFAAVANLGEGEFLRATEN
jgi:hypothetical protein